MRTYIQIHNKRTGSYEDREFPDIDSAFEEYWGLTDEPQDPDIEFELISEE